MDMYFQVLQVKFLVRRAEEKSAEEWVRYHDKDETRVTLQDNSFLEWETA